MNIDENYCTPNQKIIIDQTNISQSNQNNRLNLPIIGSEIKKAIKKLKSKKTAGNDKIRNEMLKCGMNSIVSPLIKLFNFILNAGIYPDL